MPPSQEQQEILDAQDRIRLVQAAPGSGKTWLVAEAIRQELDGWEGRHQGIAALSFTNVAGAEIRKTLKRDLTHPHFVGTIDSFLFRYVVKPFAQLRDPAMLQPILVPGEIASKLIRQQRWLREHNEVNLGSRQRPIMKNVFDINFIGGTRRAPEFATTINWSRYELSRPQAGTTIKKKREIWSASGRVSHSDAAYMAFQILSDLEVGPRIIDLLLNRFPVIFIDEVQDTGWFMGRAILGILGNDQCRALVTGDPDQAIFEFNGATPDIFQDIADLDEVGNYEIQTTLRCSKGICAIARRLSAADRRLITTRETVGRAVLASYDGEDHLPRELLNLMYRANPEKIHKLVARKNATVNRLNGGPRNEYPNFRSKPISNLYDAINALRRGKMRNACSLAEAAVGRSLFGTESPGPDDLEIIQADSFYWRKVVVQILLEADKEVDRETLFEWGSRVRTIIINAMEKEEWWDLSPNHRAPNRPNRATTEGELRADWLVDQTSDHGAIEGKATTVHSVKGETHDSTILYVPEVSHRDQCPSEVWWSDDEQHTEERRIAYVAASRARDLFVLCLHGDSLENFKNNQPEFLVNFEHMTLTDLVAEYARLAEMED